MLTDTDAADSGDFVAYPGGTTAPTVSNLNWSTGQTLANLALIPVGTTTEPSPSTTTTPAAHNSSSTAADTSPTADTAQANPSAHEGAPHHCEVVRSPLAIKTPRNQ
jgi:hypothetical protein